MIDSSNEEKHQGNRRVGKMKNYLLAAGQAGTVCVDLFK
jgi:hypothetical protein